MPNTKNPLKHIDRRQLLKAAGLTAGTGLAFASMKTDVFADPNRSITTEPNTAQQKNIVFICLDQLAADAIGPYGNRLVKTPNIDRLAARGVTFDNYWCTSPLCGPARFSLFTGQMPFANRHAGTRCQHYPYIKYMGDYFRASNYATFSVGKLHGMPHEFDFGFEDCHINDVCLNQRLKMPTAYSNWLSRKIDGHPDGARLRSLVDAHHRVHWYNVDRTLDERYFLPPELSENAWIADTSTAFLKNLDGKKPFLMHIGINHPHGSWHSQPQPDEVVLPDDVELPSNFEPNWNTRLIPRGANAEPFMMEQVTKNWSKQDWKRWLAKYYTSVNQADKAVGRVLDLLTETGHADDTTLVLTTDHGDMMGQMGLEAKYFFYNGSARIPLIIAGPRHTGRTAAGTVVQSA